MPKAESGFARTSEWDLAGRKGRCILYSDGFLLTAVSDDPLWGRRYSYRSLPWEWQSGRPAANQNSRRSHGTFETHWGEPRATLASPSWTGSAYRTARSQFAFCRPRLPSSPFAPRKWRSSPELLSRSERLRLGIPVTENSRSRF